MHSLVLWCDHRWKNIYKRGGFFFAERSNRCRTKLIDKLYEILKIILSTHKCIKIKKKMNVLIIFLSFFKMVRHSCGLCKKNVHKYHNFYTFLFKSIYIKSLNSIIKQYEIRESMILQNSYEFPIFRLELACRVIVRSSWNTIFCH